MRNAHANSVTLALALFGFLWGSAIEVLGQSFDDEREFALARDYESNGDVARAARIYRELTRHDPESRVYFDGLKRTWLQLGKFEQLQPIVEERLTRYKSDVSLRILHAELLHRVGREEEASAEWDQALESGKSEIATYMSIAQSHSDLRRFRDAIDVLELAKARFGDKGILVERLARLYAIVGDYQNGVLEYLNLLVNDPTQIQRVKAGLSFFVATPSALKAAVDVTEELVDTRGGSARLYDLLSWLYTEQGNDSAAFSTIVKLDRMRDARGSDVYGYADRMLRQGNYEMAIRAFDYFIENYGRNNALRPSALFGYVSAMEAKNKEGGEMGKESARDLIQRYREVVEVGANRTLALKARLAIAHLQADVLDDVGDALETLRSVSPEEGDPLVADFLLLQGDLQLRTGDIEKARESYRLLAKTSLPYSEVERGREVARLRAAETWLFSGEYERAVDSLTALTKNLQSVAVNDALDWLTLLNSVKESDSAILDNYVQAVFASRQREWRTVVQLADEAHSVDTSSALAEHALLLKAESLRRAGEFQDALRSSMRLMESYEGGVLVDEALYLAAEIADEDLDDRELAIELYMRLLTEHPRSSRAEPARRRVRQLRATEES